MMGKGRGNLVPLVCEGLSRRGKEVSKVTRRGYEWKIALCDSRIKEGRSAERGGGRSGRVTAMGKKGHWGVRREGVLLSECLSICGRLSF